MTAVVQRHFDAIAATMLLLTAQFDQLRHALTAPAPPSVPTVREVMPTLDRCKSVADRTCAMRDDEARQTRSTFGNPRAWRCAGCGFEGET